MVSNDRNDVDISINVDFIEQLVGVALTVMMFQYLDEIAVFDQRNNLLEADSSFSNEPGVLASLRRSTYRSVRLAPSLAAAWLDGLFEHFGVLRATVLSLIVQRCAKPKPSFSANC